ncbi:MAG: hypothetical protein ACE5IO_07095, partial [Thermoplasmata archaeon]
MGKPYPQTKARSWNVTMNTGDKMFDKGEKQWYFDGEFNTLDESATLDLAGEFNQYLSNHSDGYDGENDGNVSIPLKFNADHNGEITVYGVVVLLVPYITDPLDNDTDSDWLSDGRERLQYNTSSLAPDSDNDEITDWSEVSEDQGNRTGIQHTDPTDSDTDDDLLDDLIDPDPLISDGDYDGILDGIEIRRGTNPEDPDSDDDRLLDGFNVTVKNTSPAYDSFMNNHSIFYEAINETHTKFYGELAFGTDSLNPDSDGDGEEDGAEVSDSTNPLNPDTDGDGLLDGNDFDVDEGDWRYNVFMALAIVILNG